MGVAVRVIPCLDVDDGRVVKGVNFETCATQAIPSRWPRVYDAEGADELTFLDVTASSSGSAPPCSTWSAAPPSRCSSR